MIEKNDWDDFDCLGIKPSNKAWERNLFLNFKCMSGTEKHPWIFIQSNSFHSHGFVVALKFIWLTVFFLANCDFEVPEKRTMPEIPLPVTVMTSSQTECKDSLFYDR